MERPVFPAPTPRQAEVLRLCGAGPDDAMRRALLTLSGALSGDPELLPRHPSGHVWGDVEATAISPEDVAAFQAAGGFYLDLPFTTSFRTYWAVMPFGDGSRCVVWLATDSPARLADGLHFGRHHHIAPTEDARAYGEHVQPCPHHRTRLHACDPCWEAHHGGPGHA